ncbi:MAG: o-succinylbenzoate synthase [Actinomycetota bacterium]|nr:o-succinylbenzoate synthase [Actinomycetota bacterium]
MRIERVELRRISLPLVTAFRTSTGAQYHRDVLLVRVEGPDSEGWGECVAMNEPLYSAEYVDSAHAVTRAHLLPRLLGRRLTPEEIGPALAAVRGHPMAKAALEMAVLDAELTAQGRSLAAYLGAVCDRVPSGVSVGLPGPGGVPELLDTVAAHLAAGYRRVKLKIEPGFDIEPVRAVRERFGPDLALQVDANSAYTRADAGHLARLDPFALVLIEQPLAEDDLAGHALLSGQIATPVCLDESITSAVVAADAIDRGACSVVNIKAGRVGGYLEARRIHDVCRARGVPVWCGGMLETGLGRAANLALAALPGFTLPGDISASDRYWRRDVTRPFVLDGGYMALPGGPGLGVRPDPGFLAEVTTSVEEITPSG